MLVAASISLDHTDFGNLSHDFCGLMGLRRDPGRKKDKEKRRSLVERRRKVDHGVPAIWISDGKIWDSVELLVGVLGRNIIVVYVDAVFVQLVLDVHFLFYYFHPL